MWRGNKPKSKHGKWVQLKMKMQNKPIVPVKGKVAAKPAAKPVAQAGQVPVHKDKKKTTTILIISVVAVLLIAGLIFIGQRQFAGQAIHVLDDVSTVVTAGKAGIAIQAGGDILETSLSQSFDVHANLGARKSRVFEFTAQFVGLDYLKISKTHADVTIIEKSVVGDKLSVVGAVLDADKTLTSLANLVTIDAKPKVGVSAGEIKFIDFSAYDADLEAPTNVLKNTGGKTDADALVHASFAIKKAAAKICEPETEVCHDNKMKQCNAEGTGYEKDFNDCGVDGLVCVEGDGCVEPVSCTPDEISCEVIVPNVDGIPIYSTLIQTCNKNGDGYDGAYCNVGEICKKGADDKVSCVKGPISCTANENLCDPDDSNKKRVYTCNENGDGYTEEFGECTEKQTCDKGQCVAAVVVDLQIESVIADNLNIEDNEVTIKFKIKNAGASEFSTPFKVDVINYNSQDGFTAENQLDKVVVDVTDKIAAGASLEKTIKLKTKNANGDLIPLPKVPVKVHIDSVEALTGEKKDNNVLTKIITLTESSCTDKKDNDGDNLVDCSDGDCAKDKVCTGTCANGIKDGSETDVDCGGSCTTTCADAKKCSVDDDCTSKYCSPFPDPKVCANNDNGAITSSFTSKVENLKVTFTDTSSPGSKTIKSYAWDFGDSGTSDQDDPVHTYAKAGDYSVTLTIKGDDFMKASAPVKVTVTEAAKPIAYGAACKKGDFCTTPWECSADVAGICGCDGSSNADGTNSDCKTTDATKPYCGKDRLCTANKPGVTIVLGNADGDSNSKVNVLDVISVVGHIIDNANKGLSANRLKAANVNCDKDAKGADKVNINDLLLIIDKVLNPSKVLKCPTS